MKKKLIAALAAACVCGLVCSGGQTLPSHSAVSVRLPDAAGQWTIQFTPRTPPVPTRAAPGQPPSPGPKVLKGIYVTSRGNVRRERLVWSDGTTTDVWKINGEWFFTASRDRVPRSMNAFPGAHIFEDWKSFDTNELRQIAGTGPGRPAVYYTMPAVLYTKIETETVLNYAIFPNEAPSPGSQAPQAIVATRPMGLYVSPLTNYPIAYLDSTGTYVFTNIAEGLSEDLEPPPQYLAIAKSESDAAYVAAPVGRP